MVVENCVVHRIMFHAIENVGVINLKAVHRLYSQSRVHGGFVSFVGKLAARWNHIYRTLTKHAQAHYELPQRAAAKNYPRDVLRELLIESEPAEIHGPQRVAFNPDHRSDDGIAMKAKNVVAIEIVLHAGA